MMREYPVQFRESLRVRFPHSTRLLICTNKTDAPRILKALKGRLERFSLIMNLDKTKVIDFSKSEYEKGKSQGEINFLGFSLYFGRSKKGKAVVKVKTANKTFRKKMNEITAWCKENRNRMRLKKLWEILRAKVRGHTQYYGVSYNFNRTYAFSRHAKQSFFKWINRRSQKKSFNWEKFELYMELNPLPRTRIVHRLF